MNGLFCYDSAEFTQNTAAPTWRDACVIMTMTHHLERRHLKDKYTEDSPRQQNSIFGFQNAQIRWSVDQLGLFYFQLKLGGSGSAIYWTSEAFQLRLWLQTTYRGRCPLARYQIPKSSKRLLRAVFSLWHLPLNAWTYVQCLLI